MKFIVLQPVTHKMKNRIAAHGAKMVVIREEDNKVLAESIRTSSDLRERVYAIWLEKNEYKYEEAKRAVVLK